MNRLVKEFGARLNTPVNGASLGVFRICVGLVMLLEAWSLCTPSKLTGGGVPLEVFYAGADIRFHFPYHGFGWLPLFGETGIYVLIGLWVLSAALVTIGFCYRAASVVLFLSWGYFFAVESTRTYFQSYYYSEFLITFLLMWMPAAARFSVDAWRRRKTGPATVPFWTLFVLRGQLVIIYFYSGVAKINKDWLLDAVPLRWHLAEPYVGTSLAPFLPGALYTAFIEFLRGEGLAVFLSWAGLIFDLSIGFLLLIRRSRILGLVLMFLFHATNHLIIYDNIDWFPLVGATTALIFLDAGWPDRLRAWWRKPRFKRPDRGWFIAGLIALPGLGALLGWKLPKSESAIRKGGGGRGGLIPVGLVAVWLVFQGGFPLRHYFIEGDGRITYEGIGFSWRPKTDDRRAGAAQIYVEDSQLLIDQPGGGRRINWSNWPGLPVVYERVFPGRIDWRMQPEVVVMIEPLAGARVIYNPFSNRFPVRSEQEALDRVRRLWTTRLTGSPDSVEPTRARRDVLDAIARELRAAGMDEEAREFAGFAVEAAELASEVYPTDASVALFHRIRARWEANPEIERLASVRQLIRLLPPQAVEGGPDPGAPFFVIEDPRVNDPGGAESLFDSPALNLRAIATLNAAPTGRPVTVWMGDIGMGVREFLPRACVLNPAGGSPSLWWNTPADVTDSKLNHLSNQPFYLQRYAMRVAGVWERELGRRPAVHAVTSVSLNGRPPQPVVDPRVDLANVEARWFRHNPWINDLETPRIPREALSRAQSPE